MEIKDLSHFKGLAILNGYEVEVKSLGDFIDLNDATYSAYSLKSFRIKKRFYYCKFNLRRIS